MARRILLFLAAAALAVPLGAIQEKHGVLVGEVLRLDAGAKKLVLKAEDGTEHVFKFTARTAVHGVRGAADAARDAFRGLKEGAAVAVHYTERGSEKTVDAVDHIGKDGLKAANVAVHNIGRAGKTMVVETEKGGKETLHLTDLALRDTGKDAEKAGKMTVYYTEGGGKKVVHFFRKAI